MKTDSDPDKSGFEQSPQEKKTKAEKTREIDLLKEQISRLASSMQSYLKAGDMNSMIKSNEMMAQLSARLSEAETQQEKELALSLSTDAAPPNSKLNNPSTETEQIKSSSFSLAKTRAAQRAKELRARSSFDAILSKHTENKTSGAGKNIETISENFLSARMKERIKNSEKQNSGKGSAVTPEDLRMDLEQCCFYDILSGSPTDSYGYLHKSFLKKLFGLNKLLKDSAINPPLFHEFVIALSLAHDILKNQSARLQYDIFVLGKGNVSVPELYSKRGLIPLGLMLRVSGLINAAELSGIEQSGDREKEREFGSSLVKRGLLKVEELDSIFRARDLILKGRLTLGQFKLAMQELRESSIPLTETLLASGWIAEGENIPDNL